MPLLAYMRNSRRLFLTLSLLLLLATVLGGCSGNPNVRKQKFYAQAVVDFDRGKYPEAVISLRRALQVDPRFVEAHYKLAQCHERQGSWAAAFQELQRTIDLQPDNWRAQVELGQILLAAGKNADAKDRAMLVMHSDPKNIDARILLSNADALLGNSNDALEEARDAVTMGPDRLAVYINLAVIEERAGAVEDAEAHLERAASLDPSSIEPIMALGTLYKRQKRWREAEKQFQAAVVLAPKNPVPRTALAGTSQNIGQEAEAERVLSDAKQQSPDDPAMYRLLGDYYIARSDSARAVREFGALFVQHRRDLQVQKTYIQLLILNHRLDEATTLANELLNSSSRDAEALLLQGQIQIQRAHFDDSVTTLQQAVKLAPDSAFGHYQLGVAFHGKGNVQQGRLRTEQKRWAEAEDAYRKALLREPNSLDALEGLVDLDFRRGRASNAIRLIQTQLERTPDNSPLYSLLGQALLRNGKPAEAEQALTRATDLDKQNVGALILLGQAQASRGATDRAISNLQHALELFPTSVRLYVDLASLYESQGNWQKAETLYQKALSIQSDDAFAANNLAYLMLEHGGDVNVALTLAQTARRGLQGMPNSADTLGWAYYQNGSFSAAAPLLEEAVRKAPFNSTYLYHLGLIYAKLKYSARARDQFERAISIDPKSPIAERARSALSQVTGS